MKKLTTFLLVAILLCGCSKKPETYQFSNSLENIVSIELILNQNKVVLEPSFDCFYLIKELDTQEIQSFMNEVYFLQTKKVGTPPPFLSYGDHVAIVTYTNGDIEMLGTTNIEYVEAGNSLVGVGDYQFVGDAFEEVFLKYSKTEK